MTLKKVIINVDGASRGNPGPAAIGATIKDEKGRLITCIAERIGVTTNNQAEYRAVIAALERAITLGASHAEVKSDSELMVRQLNGQYKVRNAALIPLYERATQLAGQLEGFAIVHIPRSINADADSLANRALDAKR